MKRKVPILYIRAKHELHIDAGILFLSAIPAGTFFLELPDLLLFLLLLHVGYHLFS